MWPRPQYPDLSSYVSSAVTDARRWLLEGTLVGLALVVTSGEGTGARPLEHHAFDCALAPALLRRAGARAGARAVAAPPQQPQPQLGPAEVGAVQRVLGEALLRAASYDSRLPPAPLPADASWRLVALTRGAEPPPLTWMAEPGPAGHQQAIDTAAAAAARDGGRGGGGGGGGEGGSEAGVAPDKCCLSDVWATDRPHDDCRPWLSLGVRAEWWPPRAAGCRP